MLRKLSRLELSTQTSVINRKMQATRLPSSVQRQACSLHYHSKQSKIALAIPRRSYRALVPRRSSTRRFSTSSSFRAFAAPEIDQSNSANYEDNPGNLRIVPASPSYFSRTPSYVDDLIEAEEVYRKYQTLPRIRPSEAPRSAWKSLIQYRMLIGEPVNTAKYNKILRPVQKLNLIRPSLMPEEIKPLLARYKRDIDPFRRIIKPRVIDEYGRTIGVGRRKSSAAQVYLVEGEGDVLINGKSLAATFPRIHDRESALWALKATARLDKYNVWALVRGGGTTGQAEAITLGVARALIVHEPLLKPALRRGQFSFLW
jgi:small subunit ribosomal protein S9